jgi:excisionase family DNA binding protein
MAAILHCHVCTVRRMIADGRLPAHRLSARSLIILDCDLERFLADREVKATAAAYSSSPRQQSAPG